MRSTKALPIAVLVTLAVRAGAEPVTTGDLLTTGPSADNVVAEELFREGRVRLADGNIDKACLSFEGSLRADPTAISTIANLAFCRELNHQYATAWGWWIEVKRRLQTEQGRATADKHITTLEQRLSRLTINVPDQSRVDGLVIMRNGVQVDHAAWNCPIPVDGGSYIIEGRAPGHEPWSTTVAVDAAKDAKAVTLPRFQALRAQAPAKIVTTRTIRERGTMGTARAFALVSWSLSALSIGTGVTLELHGRGLYDQAIASSGADRAAYLDAAQASRRRAIAAGGVSAGFLSLGLVLWLTGAPSNRVVPVATSHAVGLAYAGQF